MKLTRTTRKRLWILTALVALYTVFGFFVLPLIVRSQLQKRLSAETGRTVTVQKVRTNPYTLSTTLEGFLIRERDGTQPFAGWRRLYVNADAWGSLWGEWVVSEIALEGFSANVALDAKGELNFADILARLEKNAPASPSEPGRPVRIAQVRVTSAEVNFADASRAQPFTTKVGPMNFALSGFRTVSERGAPYAFEAATESGETFSWSGTLQAAPVRSSGRFKIENIKLPKYAPYYASLVQADLTAGEVSLQGQYELDLNPTHRVSSLRDGSVALRGLKLRERGKEQDTVELSSVSVQGLQANAETMSASIGAVAVGPGRAAVRREKDGTINLIAMLRPATSNGAVPPSAPVGATKPTPDVAVESILVNGFAVDVADETPPTPAALSLRDIQLGLRGFNLKPGTQMPVQFSANWAPRGTIRLDGAVALNPMKAALKVELASVDLTPVTPYVASFANAAITQGTLSTTLSIDAALPGGRPIAATAEGTVNLEQLTVVDGTNHQDLAGFASLSLHGIHVNTAPEITAVVEAVQLAGAFANVVVNADKTVNVLLVAPPKTTDGEPPAPTPDNRGTTQPASSPKIEIGKITLVDANGRFVDRSIEPNVEVALSNFGGTITGLSSTNPAKADVDLKAAVDGTGPVAIRGKLDPLAAKPSVDLTVDVKDVDLVPLSAYSGKYAGFELARGKLLVDVHVLLDGTKLDSANVITLNQFTFGQPVESPEATKLPVRLGVALLKDRAGNIVLDVPVQGQVDDPNFRYGRVVGRVITNLLVKAATSPFSLLGAAFGGGGDELAFQEFAPGAVDLKPGENKKLETLARALENRPALSLMIEGSYDRAADSYAAQRAKLEATIRRTAWEKQRQLDPNTPPLEQFEISPEATAAAIQALYDARFPAADNLDRPAATPPPVVKAPLRTDRGLFRRVVAAITFAEARHRRSERREEAKRATEERKTITAAAIARPGVPVEQMSARLAEAETVSEEELSDLARRRAERIREYFAGEGKVAAERLVVSKKFSHVSEAGKGPRVFLHLQ